MFFCLNSSNLKGTVFYQQHRNRIAMTKQITSINPATGQSLQTYTLFTDAEVGELIEKTTYAQASWSNTDFDHRTDLMLNAAAVLQQNKEEYAATMHLEMGKDMNEAISEVEKCAWVCEYYAANAELFLAPEYIKTDATKSYIAYKPLGVILAVMPWNFPLWQVFRFAAPALMAGNGGVLKHASNVPQCSLIIEDVFIKAGFPKNLFTNLLISSSQVDKVIENKHIKAVTLTGSEKAGSHVAATAAKLIKKAVLELGGSDAYIILEDADLDLAAKLCAQSRLLNAGQSCIGAKRFVVLESVYEEFLAKFKQEMCRKNEDGTFNLAPMARVDLRDELHQQVRESIDNGAGLALGGFVPEGEGAYYPPTILTNVKPGMPAYDEELFGPVASVIKVKTETEAIYVANDSKFGLGSGIFSRDLERAERIARDELEAGAAFVNQFVKSDPRLPFGGIKMSGYGRELSKEGIREFMNAKTVYIA